MKCPMIASGLTMIVVKNKPEIADCLKQECAWWLEDIQMCALKDLALELRYTKQRLAALIDKIKEPVPGEGQSTAILKNYLEQRALESMDLDLFAKLQHMASFELAEELKKWLRRE